MDNIGNHHAYTHSISKRTELHSPNLTNTPDSRLQVVYGGESTGIDSTHPGRILGMKSRFRNIPAQMLLLSNPCASSFWVAVEVRSSQFSSLRKAAEL